MTPHQKKKQVAALLAKNPISPRGAARKKARTIGQNSQRARTTKTGTKTKKPSTRLMARRKKDTIAGYYPNPIHDAKRDVMEWLNQEAGFILRDIRTGKYTAARTMSEIDAQAAYLQGYLMGAHIGGAISERDRMDTLNALVRAFDLAEKS